MPSYPGSVKVDTSLRRGSILMSRGELVLALRTALDPLVSLGFLESVVEVEETLGCTADGCSDRSFQRVDACVSCMPVSYLQEEVSHLILFSHQKPKC